VMVDPVSNLAGILSSSSCEQIAVTPELKGIGIPVNSSHHQAVERAGDGLRVVARCPDDNVIEAVEGTQPGHFVVGVQWHPERGIDDDAPSQALLNAFVRAAAKMARSFIAPAPGRGRRGWLPQQSRAYRVASNGRSSG